MTFDREGLKRWYREAMVRRLEQLRGLRAGLRAGDPAAFDAAREVGQALRGSGATYGFPALSADAGLLESAPDALVPRRVEGLIEEVRRVAMAEDERRGAVRAEWLSLAAGGSADALSSASFDDLGGAWNQVAAEHGLSQSALADRVAASFGLGRADLTVPRKSALRLVPEALMTAHQVLPVREDAETITVATADPTSLALEAEIQRLTGRTPVFAVAPPVVLGRALAAVLGEGGHGVSPGAGRPALPDAPASRTSRRMGDGDGEGRILVVDDDPGATLVARSILEKLGYRVAEAGDGLEALERLREGGDVDLVVADLNMPRLDGLELIWEMRAAESWARIPVIVVTGETDEVLETKLIEEGADDYIRKPLDPRLFSARVAATIRRSEQ